MDARVRYTQMQIKNVMVGLLSEKEIGKITVTEICRKAMINRATFYKYYDNPYDLLDHFQDDLLNGLELKLRTADPEGFEEIFQIILGDIQENAQAYQILFAQSGDGMFRKRLFDLCYGSMILTIRQVFPKLDEKHQTWLYYLLAEGCNGVMARWFQNGMEEPIEDVVRFLARIIESVNAGADLISGSSERFFQEI